MTHSTYPSAPPRRQPPRRQPPRGMEPRQVRRPSPYYRPPWVLRALVGMIALGAVLFTVALMWSDQAPGLLKPVLSEGLRELWYRVDPDRIAAGVNRDELPRTDFMLHIAVWTVVSSLVFVTVWTWRGMVIWGGLLVAMSYAIEIGQGRFSTTRHVDITDAVANTIGIATGAVIAFALYVMWDTVARFFVATFAPRRRGRRG